MALSIADYQERAYSLTGSSGASASISWAAGDLVIVMAGVEDASFGLNTPTFSGGTFTAGPTVANSGSHCWGGCWQCTPGSSGSGTVSITRSDGNTGIHFGMSVWVFRGHNGIGTSSGTQGTNGVASLTVAANSGVVAAMFDWEADAGGYTGTPTVSTEREDSAIGSNYAVWVADWLSQSAGTRNYGVTSEASAALTLLVAEVKVSATTTIALSPATVTVTPTALARTVGTTSRSISPATITTTARSLSRSTTISRSLSPSTITVSPIALSRTTAITRSLSPNIITLTPIALGITSTAGAQSRSISPTTVTITPRSLSRSATILRSLSPSIITLTARPLSIFTYDPLNLSVSAVGSTTATLTWDAATLSGVTDYTLFRRTPPTGVFFDPLVDTPAASTIAALTYGDTGLTPATAYEWQVFGRVPDTVGYPDSTNTPHVSGSTLTYYPNYPSDSTPATQSLSSSGDVFSSSDNEIISGLDIAGMVVINHSDVIIEKCRITSGWYYCIQNIEGDSSANNLIIRDCEIVGPTDPDFAASAIGFNNYTVTRCNFHGSVADVMKFGHGVSVSESWVHDMVQQPGGHPDVLQTQGDGPSSVFVLDHCNLDPDPDGTTSDGGIFSLQLGDENLLAVGSVTVNNCRFGPNQKPLTGAYPPTISGDDPNPYIVTNNLFTLPWTGGVPMYNYSTAHMTQSNNYDNTETPVTF